MIKNPVSGKNIKLRGVKHLNLVHQNILPRETLDLEQTSIHETRSRYDNPEIIHYDRKTQWINVKIIAEQLGVNPFRIVRYFNKEFKTMKINIDPKNIMITFPAKEFFIKENLEDFINKLFKEEDNTKLNENLQIQK